MINLIVIVLFLLGVICIAVSIYQSLNASICDIHDAFKGGKVLFLAGLVMLFPVKIVVGLNVLKFIVTHNFLGV
jgi:uncharacterized membrane protein